MHIWKLFKEMKNEAKRRKLEVLEVKKIESPQMQEHWRKQKYLKMIKAIKETPGLRSGRIATLWEKH
jgi:hypothetical protein